MSQRAQHEETVSGLRAVERDLLEQRTMFCFFLSTVNQSRSRPAHCTAFKAVAFFMSRGLVILHPLLFLLLMFSEQKPYCSAAHTRG